MKYLMHLTLLMIWSTTIMAAELATFAGGCFWCMEPPFESLKGKGVIDVVAGYTGGNKKFPTYEEVSSGQTKHIESVQITFDPTKVSYETLCNIFWKNIDPTDTGGQFNDRGHHYTTAIFTHSDAQAQTAKKTKQDLENSGTFKKPIVTKILPEKPFYEAEDYHQDYYKKNALHYNAYKEGSGRAPFLRRLWKISEKK